MCSFLALRLGFVSSLELFPKHLEEFWQACTVSGNLVFEMGGHLDVGIRVTIHVGSCELWSVLSVRYE